PVARRELNDVGPIPHEWKQDHHVRGEVKAYYLELKWPYCEGDLQQVLLQDDIALGVQPKHQGVRNLLGGDRAVRYQAERHNHSANRAKEDDEDLLRYRGEL